MISHSRTTPVMLSVASVAITAQRTRSETTMTQRESNRSLTTPPISRVTTCGKESATPTADMAAGVPDSS